MNQRQIDCFIAVAQCGGFSAAARQLYLSQSTVSQQVITLETELGYPLFIRKGHSIELTAAGNYLLQHFVELRNGYDAAVATANAIAKGGAAPLRLGYDGPLSSLWLGRALFRIPKGPGNPPFTLRRDTMPQISLMLTEGIVDVAITADTELGGLLDVKFHPLASGSPCVFFAPGNKLSRLKSVTVEDLKGETLLNAYGVPTTRFLSATGTGLESKGVELHSAINCRDGDTAFMAARAGMGVFVASHLCDAYAEALGLDSVDLDTDLPLISMGVAWKEDDSRIDQLIAAAEQVVGR